MKTVGLPRYPAGLGVIVAVPGETGEVLRGVSGEDPVFGPDEGGAAASAAVIQRTDTGTVHDWAAPIDGDTLIEWAGASDAVFTGLAAGEAGQVVSIKNTGTAVARFAHLSGSSTAGNKFSNVATSAATPVGAGGRVAYVHDGTSWQLVAHEQGAWISHPHAGMTFSATETMTWTVDSGDLTRYVYRLVGRTLQIQLAINTATIGGSPSYCLYTQSPGDFTLRGGSLSWTPFIYRGASLTATWAANWDSTALYFNAASGTNFSLGVNNMGLDLHCTLEVD